MSGATESSDADRSVAAPPPAADESGGSGRGVGDGDCAANVDGGASVDAGCGASTREVESGCAAPVIVGSGSGAAVSSDVMTDLGVTAGAVVSGSAVAASIRDVAFAGAGDVVVVVEGGSEIGRVVAGELLGASHREFGAGTRSPGCTVCSLAVASSTSMKSYPLPVLPRPSTRWHNAICPGRVVVVDG